jgi:nitroreductase
MEGGHEMDSKDFAKLVAGSRTYRRFDESRRVTVEQLRQLVSIARLAPTANNTQLLRFHLSVDPDQIKRILTHHRWAALLSNWDGPELGARPTAYITICGPTSAVQTPIRNLDAGIAAQTIMLAARTMGLGGCIIKSFDADLATCLGLTDKSLAPLILLALGVPATDEKVVLEEVDDEHGVHYWRDMDSNTQHVPKLSVDELLV